MYLVAVIALCVGAIAYSLSYLVGFLPMLKAHALLMKVVGLALVISGGYYVSDHHGYQRRVAEDQAEIDRLNAEARAKEVELDKQKKATNVALRKAKDAINQKQSDINKRIDSGELRISSNCSVQANGTSSSTRGNSEDATKSEREILKSINEITAQGDIAITRLNACIDFYNKAKDLQ
jgi:hypothetical protein